MSKTTEIQEETTIWGKLFAGDRVLWIILAVMMALSILVVYSSTAKMVYQGASNDSTFSYMFKQVGVLFVSLCIIFLMIRKLKVDTIRNWAWIVYIAALGATIAAYIPGIGVVINGARRWLDLGFITIQPSEFLRVATVLILARQLASRQKKIERFILLPSLQFWNWSRSWKREKRIIIENTIPVLGPVVFACAVILPAHTSSAAILFITCVFIMLLARVRRNDIWRVLLLAGLAAVLGLGVLRVGRSDTASSRMGVWIDTLFKGKPADIYNLSDTQRALAAIHNGKLMGEGAGQSIMRVELIHPECDYAFAFIVEEYGLIVAVLVMFLYLWTFFRCASIFEHCGKAFPSFLVLGLGMMILVQAMIHILVVINFWPETGQPLPMISHGGSSTLSAACAFGLILCISRQMKENSIKSPSSESLYEKPETGRR
jgi:cell division protein FtsW